MLLNKLQEIDPHFHKENGKKWGLWEMEMNQLLFLRNSKLIALKKWTVQI